MTISVVTVSPSNSRSRRNGIHCLMPQSARASSISASLPSTHKPLPAVITLVWRG